MAMIQCPGCGKEISSKAVRCPGCGYEMPREEQAPVCDECGTVLPEGATECPACGCPVVVHEAAQPQRVSVAQVEWRGIRPETKRAVLIGAVVVALVLVIGFAVSAAVKGNQSAAYKDKLSSTVSSMWLGAVQAESACTLIHDVWYNTIYEKSSSTTDAYTKNSAGSFYDDFNTSLMILMWSDEFESKTDSIRNSQTKVEAAMKELQNPPEDQQNAYAALLSLYDSYIEITNLALDPTGNLSSYTSSFNAADSAFAKNYKAIQIYVDSD
ncbi:MAG: zinc ribbon domain-containing protein [Eubacteriales bacterium]|nr:zinc ribbon domain-containing protein [Eubacteriales bacterium]